MNNVKRKNKSNATRISGRPRPAERSVVAEGVYCNARFTNSMANLLGCVVRVQSADGSITEGIFKAFSKELDVAIDLACNVDKENDKGEEGGVLPQEQNTCIFKVTDIVQMSAVNVDLEYATKDAFATDAVISKYNGDISEKELQPWDETMGEDELPSLDSVGTGTATSANGWDASDMFRTNEQQYGVRSSYDSTLSDYTTPLQKKNTDDYKKAEAKAFKIANEIESSPTYKDRVALENTDSADEEDKYSAVLRSADNANMKYAIRRKGQPPLVKNIRPILSPQNSHSGHNPPRPYFPPVHYHSQGPPHPQSHPMPRPPPVQGLVPVSGASVGLPGPSPGNMQSSMPPALHSQQQVLNANSQTGPASLMQGPMASLPQSAIPRTISHCIVQGGPHPPGAVHSTEAKVNGDKTERDRKSSENERINTENRESESRSSIGDNNLGNKVDRKQTSSRAPDENVVAELKKFSNEFKLSDDTKDEPKVDDEKPDQEMDKIESKIKKSTLNPNAKEFVFNPNAKAFTPRSPSTQTPPPPRTHTPGSVMPVVQSSMNLPMMSAPALYTTVNTQYIVPPHHVTMTSPYPPAQQMQQGPRYRKLHVFPAGPNSLQPRHDFSSSIQAVAATGQPLLAPASLPTQQFVQYAPQGMVQAPGNPQQAIPYPPVNFYNLYSVVPRVVTPQGMTIVPQSHSPSYSADQHLPSQIYMPAHASLTLQAHPGSTGQQQAGSQAGVQPSPVHQPPPHGSHGNAPNQSNQQSSNPPQLMYQQTHTMAQPPPLQPSPHANQNSPQSMHQQGQMQQHMMANHGNAHQTTHVTQAQTHHHLQATGAYGGGGGGGPPQIVLVQQQHPGQNAGNPSGMHHPQSAQHIQAHAIHGHGGQPNQSHLIPHSTMTVSMIPASSSSGNMQVQPQIYLSHPQGR